VSSVEGEGREMKSGMTGVGGQLDGLRGQQAGRDSKESSKKERSSSKEGESQEEGKNKQHPLDEEARRLATLEKQQRGWRDERDSVDVQHRRPSSMRHKFDFTLMIVHVDVVKDQRINDGRSAFGKSSCIMFEGEGTVCEMTYLPNQRCSAGNRGTRKCFWTTKRTHQFVGEMKCSSWATWTAKKPSKSKDARAPSSHDLWVC